LFAGVATVRPGWMKDYEGGPTSGITAEDTVDADYGRLLERAYVKGLASPRGFEPVLHSAIHIDAIVTLRSE
jgi:hypothetical protein